METGLPGAGERESTDNTLAVAIGSRLRAVRRQTGLSLLGVQALSNREFRASVLGAYERGERFISVGRLQRLAKFYKVPVDQLLPQEDANHRGLPKVEETGRSPGPSYGTPVGRPHRVTIDLTQLGTDGGPERGVLQRFVGRIQMQRQDFNGRMITIRAGDLRVIACLFGFTPDAMERRLDELGLMVVP